MKGRKRVLIRDGIWQVVFWRLGQLKDLAQLLYSSDVVGVTERDRLRFWRAYCGGQNCELLRRLIVFKGRRYRRHNDRRRAAAAEQKKAA